MVSSWVGARAWARGRVCVASLERSWAIMYGIAVCMDKHGRRCTGGNVVVIWSRDACEVTAQLSGENPRFPATGIKVENARRRGTCSHRGLVFTHTLLSDGPAQPAKFKRLEVSTDPSGSLEGRSWSLVVTRGHSWSLVVTRGHSWWPWWPWSLDYFN